MAEVPEGGAELERVFGCASGGGVAVGDQPGEGLVPFFGLQSGAEFDDASMSTVPALPSEWGPRRAPRRSRRRRHVLLAVEGEAGLRRR